MSPWGMHDLECSSQRQARERQHAARTCAPSCVGVSSRANGESSGASDPEVLCDPDRSRVCPSPWAALAVAVPVGNPNSVVLHRHEISFEKDRKGNYTYQISYIRQTLRSRRGICTRSLILKSRMPRRHTGASRPAARTLTRRFCDVSRVHLTSWPITLDSTRTLRA